MKRIMCQMYAVAAFAIMLACSPMDEYKDIAGETELSYPGKVENAFVMSGDGRVAIYGVLMSDPSVVKCRIYWNLEDEWIDIPIDMSDGPQTLAREILLPEKTYSFDIYTYDAEGNRSVPVNVSGKSYGERYRSTISNKHLKSFLIDGTAATIEWFPLDKTLGPQATYVTYFSKSNTTVTQEVPVEETKTKLVSYKPGTWIEFYTVYQPEATCLDLFKTPVDEAIAK